MAPTDLGRERLDVDDDEVEQLEALVGELLELLGDVATGEDAGVDRRVERADLAADERRHAVRSETDSTSIPSAAR